MKEDKNIVYVFRKGDKHNHHIEGTYCQIINKEPEIAQGIVNNEKYYYHRLINTRNIQS